MTKKQDFTNSLETLRFPQNNKTTNSMKILLTLNMSLFYLENASDKVILILLL